jgi:hypothetical protein
MHGHFLAEAGDHPHERTHPPSAKAGHACAVADWATEAQHTNATGLKKPR